jgi:hypothetical protein
MARIRCDQCKTVSATTKGYCPECGAIFVPPYAIVGDDNQVRFSTVRDDMGQGKERKLLIKKAGAADEATETAVEEEAAPERTLADLAGGYHAPSGSAVAATPVGAPVAMMAGPVGETAFPGFALMLTLTTVVGWVTMLGGPVAAAMVYRKTHIDLAVIWSIVGFFAGLLCLVAAGAGQVLVSMETQLRSLRAGAARAE